MLPTRRTLLIVAASTTLLLTTAGFAASAFPTSVPVARSIVWLFGAEYLGRDGVVIQQDEADCGIAALQMVFRARRVPDAGLEPARAAIRRRGHGASLLELQQLAAGQGVRLTGYRMSLRELARAPRPSLVHLGDHFAVVDHVSRTGQVTMRDPSLGRLRMGPEEFGDIWTGDVLVLDPPRRAAAPEAAKAPPAPAAAPAR